MVPPDWFDVMRYRPRRTLYPMDIKGVLGYFKTQVWGLQLHTRRGDMKNLGSYFDSLAYEYSLVQAIKGISNQGLDDSARSRSFKRGLCRGRFQKRATLERPSIRISYQVRTRNGQKYCKEPLVKTSQKFRDILNERGFKTAEVNAANQTGPKCSRTLKRGGMASYVTQYLLTEAGIALRLIAWWY